MPDSSELQRTAAVVADLLKQTQTTIVFVESCTCGLASAFLAQTPGISEWMCGAFVTYQSQSKRDWLDVDENILNEDDCVSERVSRTLAKAALQKTPAAQLGIAVTGHLEKNASPEAPVMFVAIAAPELLAESTAGIKPESKSDSDFLPTGERTLAQRLSRPTRPERLIEAATGVLKFLQHYLEEKQKLSGPNL